MDLHRRRVLPLVAVLVVLTMLFGVNTYGQKKKKKKGQEEANPVMQMAPPTPQPAPVPPPRPANGSLYTDEAMISNLVADFKPRRVGDLVFVDVLETSSAKVASDAARSRDSGNLGGLSTLIGALPVSSAATAASVVTSLGTRKYSGSGNTDRNSTLQARIVARVTQVLPNGDLHIEAQKMVTINKETEWLSLSGIVRQRDVLADNSIPTAEVGDLHVSLNGKGVASADNAPGWLFRLFDKVAPF